MSNDAGWQGVGVSFLEWGFPEVECLSEHQSGKGLSTKTEMAYFVVKAHEADWRSSQLPPGNMIEVTGILQIKITRQSRGSTPGHHYPFPF